MLAQIILNAVAVWFGYGIGATIAAIGKPRKPVTPGIAVAVFVVNGLLIAGVAYAVNQL